MSWSTCFHPAIKKDLRRLSNEARDFIVQKVFPIISKTPYLGEPLHGPLKGFWKYAVGEYRIAYSVDSKRKEMIILEVGPRGGFYERLRRRLGK